MRKLDLYDILVYFLAGGAMILISFLVGYIMGYMLYMHNAAFRNWVNNMGKG